MNKLFLATSALVLSLMLGGCGEGDSEIKEPTNNSEEPDTSKETKLDSATVYEEEGIKITVKGFKEDGIYGPSIQLEIENNSTKNVTIQTHELSVNDYMIDTIFSPDVAVGKKVVDEIILESKDLEHAKIETVGTIDLKFTIIDSESFDTLRTSNMVQLKTNHAEHVDQPALSEGTLVYDANSVKIYAMGLKKDGMGDSNLMFYIENNQDKMLMVQAQNLSVDGYMVDPIFSSDIGANKKIVDTLSLFASDLEAIGVSDIKEMEFELNIIDGTTWDTLYTTEIVKLTF